MARTTKQQPEAIEVIRQAQEAFAPILPGLNPNLQARFEAICQLAVAGVKATSATRAFLSTVTEATANATHILGEAPSRNAEEAVADTTTARRRPRKKSVKTIEMRKSRGKEVRKRRGSRENLREAVLAFLKKNGEANAVTLREAVGEENHLTFYASVIKPLLTEGRIKHRGSTAATTYRLA